MTFDPARHPRLASFLAAELPKLQTPCYLYDIQQMRENHRQLQQSLTTPLVVSIKAQSHVEVLKRLRDTFTAGVEVASRRELDTVLDLGVPVYVNTPAMDEVLMRAGLDAGATIILDSLSQLGLYIQVGASRPVWLRAHVTGRSARETDHFGMDATDLEAAASLARQRGITVSGLHLFAGSRTFKGHALETLRQASDLLTRLQLPLQYLNLGGGFDSPVLADSPELQAYCQALGVLRQRVPDLLHESGRAVFASGGYFVTRVLHTKRLDGQQIAVCDGGMAQNFLLSQTERVVKRFAQPWILRQSPDSPDAESGPTLEPQPTRFVGSSCNREDVIGLSDAVAVGRGDLCIFPDCGAYNSRYTVAPFLGLPGAAEYVF